MKIFLINRNLLTSTKKLVEDLQNLGYSDIHILDNDSTYPPLLEWYKTQNVHYLKENLNERALWNSGIINGLEDEWIAMSDSDIELNSNTPKGFLEKMVEKAKQYNYKKIGLALSLDFPQDNHYQKFSKEWETKFWDKEIEPDLYIADVDTTFHLFKRGAFEYTSLRIAGDYTAKHTPWHKDIYNLDEEDLYYLEHSSNNSTFKRYYEIR